MNVAKQKEWLEKTGCQYQCFSFAFVGEKAFYYSVGMRDMMDLAIQKGVGIMMDSGAFSFHKFMKKKPTKSSGTRYHLVEDLREKTIQDYVEFIKTRGKQFDFYVNFDYTKDIQKVYEVQKKLEKMGINPMPIFHGDGKLDGLERYLDEGYNYIGTGSMANPRPLWTEKALYYDSIFNLIQKYETRGRKIKVHGFGITYPAAMWTWPWYSVDSTTWCMNGAMGRILIPTIRGLRAFHCSEREADLRQATNMLEPSAIKSVTDFVESKGFNFADLRKYKQQRDIFNGWVFSHLNEWKDRWTEHRGTRVKWQHVI